MPGKGTVVRPENESKETVTTNAPVNSRYQSKSETRMAQRMEEQLGRPPTDKELRRFRKQNRGIAAFVNDIERAENARAELKRRREEKDRLMAINEPLGQPKVVEVDTKEKRVRRPDVLDTQPSGQFYTATPESLQEVGYGEYTDQFNAGTEVFEEEVEDKEWLENVLNKFDQSTYHLTLWMAPRYVIQEDSYRTNGTIVAETGSTTRFHIDNLEIASPVGGSELTSNVASKISFTITEPNGAGLFPAMIRNCAEQGIEEFIKAGFCLEIRFKGRDKNTGLPLTIGNACWRHKLVVLDIAAKHDVTGSTYMFDTISTGNVANIREFNMMEQQLTVPATATLGEALKALETELNLYHEERARAMGAQTTDSVKIEFPSAWSSWKIIQDVAQTENLQTEGTRDMSLDKGGLIKDFIGTIILNTEQMVERMEAAGADVTENRGTEKVDKFMIEYFKVNTSTSFGSILDEVREEYAREVTYTIVEKLEQPAEKQSRYMQIASDPGLQRQKIGKLVDTRLLSKRYDYIYTGLNTEVLQFDAVLNNSHIVPEAIYLGTTSYPNNSVNATAADGRNLDHYNNDAEFKRILREESNAKRAVQSTRNTVNRLEVEAQELEQLNAGAPIDTLASLSRQKAEEIAAAKKARQEAEDRLDEIDAQKRERLVTRGRGITDIYLGDVVEEMENILRHRFLPVKSDRNEAISRSALIALQRQKQQVTQHLLNIELGIKGDPYWLGMPDRDADNNGQRELSEDSSFNYDNGPPFFLFSQYFPTTHDGDGRMKPMYNGLYSGLYRTMTVIHQMRNGMFSSFLSAVRDTSIQEEVVRALVESRVPGRVGQALITRPDVLDTGVDVPSPAPPPGSSFEPKIGAPGSSLSERQTQAMDWFTSEEGGGYTVEQAAGIVANLSHESDLKASTVNPGDGADGSDSVGIGQWNSTRAQNLNAFKTANPNLNDFEAELAFVSAELAGDPQAQLVGANNETGADARIRAASDPGAAAIGMSTYERYGYGEVVTSEYGTFKANDYRHKEHSPQTQARMSTAQALAANYGGG